MTHDAWRHVHTDRFAVLHNGEEYFPAFVEAVRAAKRCVYIAGWDVDSRVALLHRGAEHPLRLGALLDQIAAANPHLHVYVLPWDFSILFAAEREPAPILTLGWKRHERVHYHADGEHPFGASHHQKFVVVDDAMAFVGGMDLAVRRWDLTAHPADAADTAAGQGEPDDASSGRPRRVDPEGEPYGPYHDVQAVLDGDAALALGVYFRRRWRRATGEALQPPETPAGADLEASVKSSASAPLRHDPWPEGVRPLAEGVPLGIVRTQPGHKDERRALETEAAILDCIRRAKRSIYIENQYLSAQVVVEALAARLKEPAGPEIVLVLPRRSSSWLARKSMDMLREVMMQRLESADHADRLRIRYPAVDDRDIYVHAKVLIADDDLCLLGSANLANRSMGLDTELGIVLDAEAAAKGPAAHAKREDIRRAIARLRTRLLAELTGETPQRVATVAAEAGGLVATVDRLGADGHTLRPIPRRFDKPESLQAFAHEEKFLDPEQPLSLDRLMDIFLAEAPAPPERKRLRWPKALAAALFGLVLVGLVFLWRHTNLDEHLSIDAIVGLGAALEGKPWAGLVVVAGFFFGGLIMAPITLLVVATAIIFDPLAGVVYGLLGCLASATGVYWAGRLLGRDVIRRLAGDTLNRLSRQLARRGVLAVAVLRNMPIAPYNIVNLVAGASHIRFQDYLLGTLLGMAPGVIAINLFSEGLIEAVRNPTWKTMLLPAVIAVGFLLFGHFIRRFALRRGQRSVTTEPDASPVMERADHETAEPPRRTPDGGQAAPSREP